MGDIDMAVAMPIADAAALFRDAGLKVVETGLEHGTVTVVADGEAIEVTQTRVDLDTNGRHATVKRMRALLVVVTHQISTNVFFGLR